MPLQTVPKEQLRSVIVAALAEHPAMYGLVAEIPANLPISEEWHQVNTSEANWRIAPLQGASMALTCAIGEVVADLRLRYRLDLPPWGGSASP